MNFALEAGAQGSKIKNLLRKIALKRYLKKKNPRRIPL